MMSSQNNRRSYKLSQVVEKTGLKADTLRAWERRYGLPSPMRSPGGHRLYSQRDVETIQWLLKRQEEGMRISQAVALWQELLASDYDPLRVYPTLLPADSTLSALDSARQRWLEACLAYDEAAAESILNQAFATQDVETVSMEILQRGLRQIGELWYQGKATVQQEHFSTALVTRRVNSLIAATPPATRPTRLVITTPAGEGHYTSALFLTLYLRRRGFEVIYLGGNTPAERLSDTVNTLHADAVILPVQILGNTPALLDAAQALHENNVPAAYGGFVFNTTPALRDHIPAAFLGESLNRALLNIESLLENRLPYPEPKPPQREFKEAKRAFYKASIMIEVYVELHAAAPEIPQSTFTAVLAQLKRQLLACLTFGNLDFMLPEIQWLEGLLDNYRMDKDMLPDFWNTYLQAIKLFMPSRGEILSQWLQTSVLQPGRATSI